MVERKMNGRGKSGGGRTQNEVFGRKNGGDTGKHKHVNFLEGKYFISIQQLSSLSYNFAFYRNREKGSYDRTLRCVVYFRVG